MNGKPWLLLAALCLWGCARNISRPDEREAEVKVYIAQAIRTNDASRPVVQALAVRDGKVLALGTEPEVMRAEAVAAARDVDVVHVPGVIVPGLVDAHAHLASLGRSLTVQSLRGTKSAAEVVARMKRAPRESFQGDWLTGRGWDQNDWPAQADGTRPFPTRQLLDAVFPATPVWLTRVDGHAAWASSEALRRAGITRTTVDPAGGRILRDAGGEPTGVLIDNAMELVSRAMPALTDEQLQRRLKLALERAAAVGLTGVHDAGMDLRTFTLLQQWDALGVLPIRVYAMAEAQGPDEQQYLDRGPFQGRRLSMRAVKFLADGALGSRGAALHAPYADEPAVLPAKFDPHAAEPSHSGLLLLSPEELEAKAEAFMSAGFQVAVHAIGDRANTLVLDVLERASRKTGGGPGRHRLEHAQVMRPEDLRRLKALGVIASMQPTHATSDMPWAEARLGPARMAGAYAWKSVLDSGATLAFGSDFPVEEPEPLLGFYAARTRQDPEGKPEGGWYPSERLSGEQTLEAFTLGAAFASFSEERRGKLSPGMDADFVALSVDPVSAEPQKLLGARVITTVVEGVAVYEYAPLQPVPPT